MPDSPFLSARHPASRRLAVFDGDGTSAWLYLSAGGEVRPEADVWVYNRVPAPEASQAERYRGGPPPAARGYAGPESLCEAPELYTWSLRWSSDGDCVALARDGLPVAFIAAGTRRGRSRFLARSGPWGRSGAKRNSSAPSAPDPSTT
jgi:hypothetical protein